MILIINVCHQLVNNNCNNIICYVNYMTRQTKIINQYLIPNISFHSVDANIFML